MKELIESGRIIADFIIWMDAGRETDGDERLDDDTILLNYSGAGCGIFVTVGQFRKFARILGEYDGENYDQK